MENSATSKAKRLIVTADDFGLTRGVNEAIVWAHTHGIVTSASLLAKGSAFDSAAALTKEHPTLDIGLHLDFGNDPVGLAKKCFRGQVRDAYLEQEIRSQIEKVLSAGIHITHIDGHKHVHVIPQVTRMICHLAPEYGIKGVRAVSDRATGLGPVMWKQFVFAKLSSAMWRLSRRKISAAGFVSPDRFYGITQTGFLDCAVLTAIIRDLRPGVHELMCHPGYVDDALKSTPTRLLSQRERELELLTRTDVRVLIEKSSVKLISYKDLVEGYGLSEQDTILHRHSAI
jgi:predicted glycoside hydrolase/deacetylase ChbG (UPF0249 family)